MRSRAGLFVALSHCVVALVVTAGQQASIAPGDASLAGRVINRESERPLEHVVMTLASADRKHVLTALTDANGRYLFEGIAAGEYRVTAFLDGYGLQEYGNPGMHAGRELLVRAEPGRVTRGIDFSLWRAGSITGRITKSEGQPVKDAFVTATVMLDDRLFITGATQARTDERGEYTIQNVPVGPYRISATWVDPEMLRARAGVENLPTYFPGTDKTNEASAVRVGAGETVRNINISLTPTDLLRISGHVLRGNSEGRIEANLLVTGWSTRTVSIADDGAFDVTHLKPGRYTLWARAGTDALEAACMTLDLESDMTGLMLSLAPTGGLAGRVVTDDGSPLPDEGLQVAAFQADQGKQIDLLPRDRVDVTDGGRFDVRGLFGERLLRVLGLSPEWDVDRVLSGKTAVQTFTVASGEQTGEITIVVKRR